MTHEERAAEVVDAIMPGVTSTEARERSIKLLAASFRSIVKEERRKVHAALESLPEEVRSAALAAIFPSMPQPSPVRTGGWKPEDSIAPIANFKK